jgi:hypothetical protein
LPPGVRVAEVRYMRIRHFMPALIACTAISCADPDPDAGTARDTAAPSAADYTAAGDAPASPPRADAASCDVAYSTTDRAICPPLRVGPITSATTRAEVAATFDADLQRDEQVDVGEGTFEPGTRINVGRADSATIVWRDSTRTQVRSVVALGPAWRTPDGLGVGSSLSDIEAALGKFAVLGFGWDYGGTLMLEGTKLERSGLFLRTEPRADDARAQGALQRLRGDQPFASDDPDVRALDLVVRRVDVIWPQ